MAPLQGCGCSADESIRCSYAGSRDRRRATVLRPGDSLRATVRQAGGRAFRFSVRALGEPLPASSGPRTLRVVVRGGVHQAIWEEAIRFQHKWDDIELQLEGFGEELSLEVALGEGARRHVALGMPRLISPAPEGKLPAASILLYLIDTLRPDHMSIYGHDRPTTPAIDSYFQPGWVFTRAYSTAAWTRPATASLLTGLYPSFHGADSEHGLAEEVVTLAERLRDAGWSTWAFVGNGNVNGRGLRFEQGFDRFVVVRGEERPSHPRAADIHAKVLEHLAGTADEPFFLYIHTVDPHGPYDPPAGYRNRFSDPAYSGPIVPDKTLPQDLKALEPTARDLAQLRALYDESILYQDDMFGELLRQLAELGWADRLLTVLTSDHGEEFFEHRGWAHGKRLYEEQVRIPMLIRGPGLEARRIDAPVQLVDIMPTLLPWFGLEPGPTQGLSVAALSAQPAAERAVYCEEIRPDWDRSLYSLHEGPHKLILSRFHLPRMRRGSELFHLDLDPGETTDRTSEERRQLHALRTRLEGFQRQLEGKLSRPSPAGKVELDAETREQLRALGYIGNDNDP